MFNTFAQFDLHHNRRTPGTGLGLAITNDLVKAMGGDIWVESVYGEGTVFHVAIPLALGDPRNIATANVKTISISAPDARILVVDDNEMNLSVASGLLKTYDIICDTALSGEAAIEMARAQNYHIIFMDHMMPDMDGVEATRILRQSAEGQSLIIVALTANAVLGTRKMLINSGMNDFLAKPIDRDMLANQLIQWLPGELVREKDAPAVVESEHGLCPTLQRLHDLDIINVPLGLKRIGGDQKAYIKALEILQNRLPATRSRLRSSLESADKRNFVIEVHGVKGSLANIGAEAQVRLAAELEDNGGIGDIHFCEKNLPKLDRALDILQSGLKEAFAAEEETQNYVGAGDSEALEDALASIQEYIARFESEEAFRVLEQLRRLDFGKSVNRKLATLSRHLDEFDYEGAILLISECR